MGFDAIRGLHHGGRDAGKETGNMTGNTFHTSKAAFVAETVTRYRDQYDNGEELATALGDLVADLLHYADTLPEDERDHYGIEDTTSGFADYVLHLADMHYSEERADATADGFPTYWASLV